MSARWKLDDGRSLTLLMPKELEALPDGARLVCIDGTEVVKGQDKIDDDTRGGYLAYGVLDNAQRNPPCPDCATLEAEVARLTALVEKAYHNGYVHGGPDARGNIYDPRTGWLAFQQREGLAPEGEGR